jgi:hypothetical protein
VFNKAVARLGCPSKKGHPSVQECTQVYTGDTVLSGVISVILCTCISSNQKPCLSLANFGIPENVTENVTENVQKRTFIFLVIVVRSLSVRHKIEQKKTKKRRRRRRRRGGRKRRTLMSFVASTLRK